MVDPEDYSDALKVLRRDWRVMIEGDGDRCPCCDRWGRIYKRHINETMARSLAWLCDAPAENGWVNVPVHAPRWVVRSNQLPTLRWWDLVERATSDDVNKKYSGLWRPTDLGRAFAAGEVSVPRTVYTYNGERERYGDEMILISECFGTRFSYAQVMAGSSDEDEEQ